MSNELIAIGWVILAGLFACGGLAVAGYTYATQEKRARARARARKDARAEQNLKAFLDAVEQRQDGRW